MSIGLNGMNGTFQAWGTLGTETSQGARMDESKGRESTSFSVSSANLSGERVSLEVENDITHDDDVSKEFAEYKYPVPTLRVEEMSAHGL